MAGFPAATEGPFRTPLGAAALFRSGETLQLKVRFAM